MCVAQVNRIQTKEHRNEFVWIVEKEMQDCEKHGRVHSKNF